MMKIKNRNHYVPRFLIAKFAATSKPEKDKYFPYVHKKGDFTKKIESKDVGMSKFFHGKVDDNLENSIELLERQHAIVVGEIVKNPSCVHQYQEQISDFAWLLGFRTRNIRRNFSMSLEGGLGAIASDAKSDQAMQYIYNYAEKSIGDEMAKRFPLLNRNSSQFNSLKGLLLSQIRLMIQDGSVGSQMQFGFELIQSMITEDAIAEMHNKSMEDYIAKGAKHPEKFNPIWSVLESKDENFVLGDAGCFCIDTSGNFGHLIGSSKNISAALLPISPDHTLVGNVQEQVIELDETDVVLGAFQTADEFVFASSWSEKNQVLAESEMGIRSQLIHEDEYGDLSASVWQDLDE